MLTAKQVVKKFEGNTALNTVDCSIKKGSVYGIVGSNGAGKSTLLRLLSGVYRADAGTVALDGQPVYENPFVKKRLCFIADELFFLPQADLKRMAGLYRMAYRDFNGLLFENLVKGFGLDTGKRIQSFSKGMKRQAASICALSCGTDYVLFDETFDGLDPVMRNALRKAVYAQVCERGMTAVITSHSLRELEDTCDTVALLHQGKIVLESEVEQLKAAYCSVQAAFDYAFDRSLFEKMAILRYEQKGKIAHFVIRSSRQDAELFLAGKKPVLLDILPMTLEEVFMAEMENLGYAVDTTLFKKEA